MNTSSMYVNKFSSGTILALLALSGMLFLVPLAVPVHAAQNASQPTITANISAYITGVATSGTTLKISNPIANAYAITSITIFAPTGYTFSGSPVVGTYLTVNPTHTAAAITFTGSLPPGFTDTIGLGTITVSTASPATAAPPTATFTTTLIDGGSSPGSYPGPTWSAYALATGTSISVTPTGSSTFTAGSAPVTITATDSTGQLGVPVTFSVTTAPTTGYTATVSPTSATTGSTGTATTTFTPSNHAGDATTVTANIGGGVGALTGVSGTLTTIAAAPSTVTFYLSAAAFPTTDYVTADVSIGSPAVLYANIGSGITYAATDAFGNAAGGAVTGGTLAAANGFLLGAPATTTCAVITTCAYGTVPQYSQSGVYGTIGQLAATLTGSGFSVSGTSGYIQTSTFATTAALQYPTATPNPLIVASGTSVNLKVNLNIAQTGVPVKIAVCDHATCAGTSAGYSGTIASASGVTNSTGSFSATLAISTTVGALAVVNATVTKPVNGASNLQSFTDVFAAPVIKTGPGAAAKLQVYAVFGNGVTAGGSGAPTKDATSGATVYVDAALTDAYGNVVTNTSPQQVQVTLSASGGLLSATTVYIAAGSSSTNATSGPVAWTLPTALGASTVTATAVVAGKSVTGSATVTTISPIPTIAVTSPKPASGIIYSNSPFVTFSGQANASAGYPAAFTGQTLGSPGYPTGVTITSIGYKINTGHWQTATVGAHNTVVWSVPATFPTGISTVQFNATDSKSNVGVSTTYKVLVDEVAPTFTIGTVSGSCVPVTITSGAGDFNTTSFKATFGTTPIPATSITWAGTQTLGTAGTLTATICGLTAGTGTLTVSGTSLTGVTGTTSGSVTTSITQADSVSFGTGSATWGTSGAVQGVFVPVTNSLGTSQQLTIYATLKSGTSTYVLVGGETLTSGQTGTVFLQDFLTTVPAGTYSVTFSAITTSNLAVSGPTTAITVTVP
jgi:hypothetical protein